MKTINSYSNNSLYIKQKSGIYRVYISKDCKNRLRSITWRVLTHGKTPYVYTLISNKKVYLHRYIMSFPKGGVVDHINKITLDNRLPNLRVTNYSVNNHNVNKNSKNLWPGIKTSKKNNYRVYYSIKSKEYKFGDFNSLKDAIICKRRIDRMLYT